MKRKKGFTFIELLVVLGVLAITLPAVFSIVFILLQQQVKILRLTQVKREGDLAFNIMENTIRDRAASIYSSSNVSVATNAVCDYGLTSGSLAPNGTSYTQTSGSQNFYFKDIDSNYFNFYLNGTNQIASASPLIVGGVVPLTTTKTQISNLTISCSRQANYDLPVVSIGFTICYSNSGSCNSNRPEETATLTYQSNIRLRR